MVKRTGTSYQAYYNSGSGWTSYGSAETISAIPNQAPAGDFASSTISGFQAWANFSSNLVSGDTPTAAELLGNGGSSSAVGTGSFDGPGNGFTGNDVQSYTDLSMSGGRGLNLEFDRTYNSLTASEAASTLSPFGNLGPGWVFNYGMFAAVDGSGNVTIQQEDGSQVAFTDNSGTYTPATHVLATLQLNTGQTLAPNCPATAYVLTRHDQSIYAFYGASATDEPLGALCEELDINGYPMEMTYDGSNRLTTVTEYTNYNGSSFTTNRTFTLAYSGATSRITSVTSSANTGVGTLAVTFTYNGSNQLATSADADGNTTYYSYNNEGLLDQIQTPNEHTASATGALIYYDTSGRARYTQDAAAEAAGENAISSDAYQCSYVYPSNNCSSDGTQTTTP